ncbi:D-alanyl-D-alanine carboxypeptidase family protein [Roseomonas sp. CAU 1739]|uniref:D-alanyl-D-alanine carboxypeptidase family protein n=1 Tax=Roseomonas sp. CAU 1739 TaxID=3140364 RepID=UPI00325C2D17
MTSSSARSRPTRAPWRAIAALAAGLALGLAAGPAAAQIGSDRYSAIVLDARNGNVLIAANPDEQRYPASLTKMMTLYMLFEALRDGRVQLATPITMSEEAASRPPSKLGLRPGMTLSVEQAILALVTKSANDVAAAVGEHLGGNEERFGQLMTMRARAIGMTRTTFRNASGLPDPDNVTTARDMATLGLRLVRDFPDRYRYFSTVQFAWGRQLIRNHNRMLGDYDGVDGIKTGFIRDSGFNIVTSALRDGVRLVGVTMGGASWVERDRHMGALLDQGFAQVGVAARPPSGLMAAAGGVVGAARAATAGRAPDRRAASTRAATASRVGAGRGTTAAAAATRAVATPRGATTPRRQSSAPATQQASTRAAARIEQGSRSGTPSVSAGRGSLPPPVRRPGVATTASR